MSALVLVPERPLRGLAAQLARRTFAAEPVIASAYCGFVALVCGRRGADPAQVWRQLARREEPGHDPAWRSATDIRAIALYLVNTVAEVPQHLIARATDLTPGAVCKALRRVEARRDDLAFDAELAALEYLATGRRA